MKTYSITQVRQLLSVDNKTLARWLEKEGITLQPSPHDERVKRITQDQLELLASIHERSIGVLPVEKEVHPTVKALERKVSDQAEQIALLEAEHGAHSKQGEQLASAHEEVLTRLRQLEDRMSTLEAELHDIRVVYLSKLLDYDPEQFKHLNTRLDALEQHVETTLATKTTPAKDRATTGHPAGRGPAPTTPQSHGTPVAGGASSYRIVIASLDELPEDALPYHEFVNALKEAGFSINARGFRDRVDAQFAHYAYYHEARKEWKRYFTGEQQETIRKALPGQA